MTQEFGLILLKRERPYYTERRCLVETTFYVTSKGVVVEATQLSRLTPLFFEPTKRKP